MKKNIFKKAGRVFTSLALAVSICLTMSVSVFAKNGNDLENKNINYRDYLYFVIDGKDYKMTDLTTEPGVDLSGSNVSAEVYAKVDMDGLNAAMKASGSKDTLSCTRIHICHVMKNRQSRLCIISRMPETVHMRS